MEKLKQAHNESVQEYSIRFEETHREFMRAGLDSRDISVRYFVRGLKQEIYDKVEEDLTSSNYFTKERIDVKETRKAINAVRQLAIAKENSIKASAQLRLQRQSQSRTPSQPQSQPHSQSSNAKSRRRNNWIDIPEELYIARRKAGVCFRCNSNKHSADVCKQPINNNEAPPPRSARANTMRAESEANESSESGTESEGKANAQQ
jgi:hypothetical protein